MFMRYINWLYTGHEALQCLKVVGTVTIVVGVPYSLMCYFLVRHFYPGA